MGRLAGGMVLPLPFHSLVLAFCHMVHPCYGSNNLATDTWQGMGMLYTYIVHMIPQVAEEGCTSTLYLHGWSHTWFSPRIPMLYPMRTASGISGWPRDMPPCLVLGKMPALVKVRSMSYIKSSCKKKRRSPVPKFGCRCNEMLF